MKRSFHRLFRPGTKQAIDRELLHHVEERGDRLIDKGWDPAEARKEAEKRFGEMATYRAELVGISQSDERKRWMMGGVDSLWQDLRYALRSARRKPGFAAALVITLGLGIGANAAIFTVVDALLVRPLPYLNSDRLVHVGLKLDGDFTVPWVNADQITELRGAADYFEASAVHTTIGVVRTPPRPGREGRRREHRPRTPHRRVRPGRTGRSVGGPRMHRTPDRGSAH